MTSPVTVETLTDWLLRQVADEEADARAAIDARRPGTHWRWVYGDDWHTADLAEIDEAFDHGGAVYLVTVDGVNGGHAGALPHIARWDPARVLAECESKRGLLVLHRPSTDHGPNYDPYCVGCWEEGGMDGAPSFPCRTARLLALPYADRPGFPRGMATMTTCDGPTCHEHGGVMSHDQECSAVAIRMSGDMETDLRQALAMLNASGYRDAERPAQPEG